jgi:hypothetical protein
MAEDLNFNFGEFLSGLATAQKEVIDAAVHAVDLYGEQLIGNAQEYAPIETGALQASGTATDAKVEGDEIAKVVGFNVDYAAARHERPPEKDAPPKINPKGQWKFLQRAMSELAPKFEPFVGEAVKGVTGGGE